jgi:hypothetical protein
MSTYKKRLLLAGVVVIPSAVVLTILAGLPSGDDEMAEACGRVPLGADRATVEAAVGRPADSITRRTMSAEDPGRVLSWSYDEGRLAVEFDAAGRSVKADVYYGQDSTFWERFWNLITR